MNNYETLGGYIIENDPKEDDWLWFTGKKWISIPYGTYGEITDMITTPYPNLPFISNGYIVSIEELKPGQILAAVCTYNEQIDIYHEYITNCNPPNMILYEKIKLSYNSFNSLGEESIIGSKSSNVSCVIANNDNVTPTLNASRPYNSYNIELS